MTHPHMYLHIFVRWLDFVALVTVLGGLSYRYFVWIASPGGRTVDDRQGRGRIPLVTMLAVLLGTSLTDLVLRSLMMSGKPVSELFSVLPTVLTKTHFGSIWILRIGLIFFLGAIRLIGERKIIRPTGLKYLSLGGGMALGLTTSLSGHAADQGSWNWTVFGDWIHVMAISGWVGGLFALQMHLRPSLAGFPEAERRDLLAAAIRRFSAVAMTCVGAMLLTGVYNTWVHVHSPSLLVGTDYGRILILKWFLIVPMLLLGGVNRFYILPILENRDGWGLAGLLARAARTFIETIWTRPKNMGRLFFQMILIEAVLGLGVLGCTAWITQLPPPHQPAVGFEHDHHTM
jgi:putative copper resistance protein D